MVPTKLLYDDRIKGEALRAWAVLDDIGRGTVFEATAFQLAEVLGCSDDKVERITKALEGAGWLKVQRRRGNNRANRYLVIGSKRAGSGSRTDAGSQDPAELRVPSVEIQEGAGEKEDPVLRRGRRQPASPGCADCDHGQIQTEAGWRKCPVCFPPPF